MSTGASRKLSLAVLVVAAFVAGAFFVTSTGSVFGLNGVFGSDAAAQQAPAEVEEGMETATELGSAFASVAERVNPAVVSVRSAQLVDQPSARNPFQGTPFEEFFGGFGGGMPNGEPIPRQGLGSGAIVRSDGYIVTNNHVVEDADELTVVFYDGTELPGEVVGTDPFSDLAVVKVDEEGLPTIPFGDAEDLRVGQWVLAFGSPLQERLNNTVTAGIISAVGRFSNVGTGVQEYIQ
ncbi:MAG: trypsin-like peptidase domain-containing protein, partial [Rhodothermales bacterium]|nr:trypsin-like peptidase domain-containing protein [Rhodothermales bacterium]